MEGWLEYLIRSIGMLRYTLGSGIPHTKFSHHQGRGIDEEE
ncbi:MAG: hypothetical protein Q8M98_05370 [Candidatus Cloacimonadaceae bacterium]|nr:hypothetical protein [Candidatus Cloacimonadaceae bacterium]